MLMNKYVIKNKLNGTYDGIFLFKTDAMAARKVTYDMVQINKTNKVFDLNDIELLKIGTFDNENGDEVISDPVVIPFENRLLTETDGTADPVEVNKDINNIR